MNHLFKKRIVLNKSYADMGLAIVVILLTLYMLFIGNYKFIKIGFGAVGKIDDRLFPTLLMVVALLCALAILFLSISDIKRDKRLIAEGKTPATVELSIMALALFAVGFFFYFTMKTIGYPLSSFISIYAVYYLHGGGKIWKGVLLSGLFTLACYLFFGVYLGVNLPLGFGL
jgi:hypothetical protein